jgi:two-component system sensor histidine kinase YesM
MWNKNLHQTIFGRLLRTFLIIIIPIYLLGIFMNRWGVEAIKNEIAESMSSQVVFYLEDIENDIRSMKMLQYDCLGDENINRLAILSEIMNLYESQQRMLQLQKRLLTIRNSSDYIEDVTAHIEPISKTISANSGIIDLDKEEYENIRISEDIEGAQFIVYEGALYMTTYDERIKKNTSSPFSIVIKLDRDKLVEKLEVLNRNEESGVVLIYQIFENRLIDETNNFLPLVSNSVINAIIDDKNNVDTLTVEHNNEKYYTAYAKSEFLKMTLIKYMPDKIVMQPLNKIYAWFWIFSGTSLLIFVVYSLSTYKYIHEPMSKLVQAFKKVEKGNMDVVISHSVNDEFGYIYKRFNQMVQRISQLIDQVYKQKIMTQRAELKQLQSQINPHFLYNSFFLINTMARIQDENLMLFTKYLGEYFRFVTKNGADTITLEEEIQHARVYVDIQKMRFSKRLNVLFQEVPQVYKKLKVPRLIVQPIIENAFEHAVEKKKSGEIRIQLIGGNGELVISVEDNGDTLTEEKINHLNKKLSQAEIAEEISGLINVNHRVRMMYGEKFGVSVRRSMLGGLYVELKIQTTESYEGECKDV